MAPTSNPLWDVHYIEKMEVWYTQTYVQIGTYTQMNRNSEPEEQEHLQASGKY